jgi:hypothetical protein
LTSNQLINVILVQPRERTTFATGISDHPDTQRNIVLDPALLISLFFYFLIFHSFVTADVSVLSILSTKKMGFEDGNLAVRELSSQRYKDRDEKDMARVGKRQRFEVSYFRHIFYQMEIEQCSEISASCPCWGLPQR